MGRIVYVNGDYIDECHAKISIFDRGFLFSDSVYEVTPVLDGKLIDWVAHHARLKRSLRELGIKSIFSNNYLLKVHREIIRQNNLKEGIVYLQITRGSADRDFIFDDSMTPSLIVFSQAKEVIKPFKINKGISIMTAPDIRWHRSDIKTTQLVAASLLKVDALSKSFDDVWMIKGDYITEGTSNNAFIIDPFGKIITHDLSQNILGGVTRSAILAVAKEEGLIVEQRPFNLEEAYNASEAFITSSSIFIRSVVKINQKLVANGKPGKLVARIINKFCDYFDEHKF